MKRITIHVLRVGWLLALASTAAAAAPPNLVFILADDLAMGDLGCYGQKLIQTPNLDRMAAEGTRYTQGYSGTTVCAPSRASLMTGLHMGHCPVRANREIQPEGQMPLPPGTVTVARLLKKAGYATACIGKWGMGMFDTTGSPLKVGFHHFYGYNCQRHAHSYFPTYLYNDDQQFELPGNDGKGIGKTYAQALIADETLKWVRANKDHPFFLFYSVTLPHGRHEIDDLGIYADKPWTAQQKSYAAQVTRLDADVGRLLALLKELNLDQRTLVMLAGDNGSSFAADSEIGKLFDQTMDGRLRGFKRTMYEGGLRQAAIARWPGVVPARRLSDEPWAFWDFLPTAVELAGAMLPPGFRPDGFSLVSSLKGGLAPQRDFFYWELHEGKPIQAVRFGDWKAVKNGPKAALELYDLKTDSAESRDLASERRELAAKAEQLMRRARVDDANWPLAGTGARGGRGVVAGRPNLILVTGDDMGFQLGCYGDTVATTPHMDGLARNGTRFTRGYITQASCSPSRSSMLTGLYPHQNGQIGLAHLGYAMRPDLPTLPSLLKKAEYRTGIIGKLHVAPGSAFDFDYKQTNTADTRDLQKVRAKCNAFLGDLRAKPLFLMLNFFDPHDPHLQDVQGSPKAKVSPEQAKVFPFMGTNSPALRRRVAEYTTCVNRVDEGVGVLLEVLREHGLHTNTFIVVLGDNGPPVPRAKVTSFEAGVNVPLIAWWPGEVKSQVSDALVCSIDLMPTFLELAGASPLEGLPGRSLLPLLRGQAVPWRERLATEYTTHEPRNLNPQRSIRGARYKLTVTLLKAPAFQWPEQIQLEDYRRIQRKAATGDYIELYDLKDDPHEFKNLAGQPELKVVQDGLWQELLNWRRATQDPLLDLAALRALVLKEKDAPPTPVPTWKKAQQARKKRR